jgi:hypothetical protein
MQFLAGSPGLSTGGSEIRPYPYPRPLRRYFAPSENEHDDEGPHRKTILFPSREVRLSCSPWFRIQSIFDPIFSLA